MDIFSAGHAKSLDDDDPLGSLRNQFFIPNKGELARKTLAPQTAVHASEDGLSTYLCGNSLGLQPLLTRQYIQDYLDTWATKGVYGHFKKLDDSHLPPWLDVDDDVRAGTAAIVGALPSEVVVMQTLTANLHLMMLSFYKPTKDRFKILLEGKAFPSDHYAVESQLRLHGLEPKDTMILIQPPSAHTSLLSTAHILSTIDAHASDTALLLLPGIQFYTGQYFDIPQITAHARRRGIIVGWDLAHAAGNVPLQLHDWNVDFACWCTYKYLNSGPGAAGGCFIHERHGKVEVSGDSDAPCYSYRPRLSGWWGSAKSSRFQMSNQFEPISGASGFQLSNPSVADLTAIRASLDVFKKTDMKQLRQKSVKLTAYLEALLDELAAEEALRGKFSIITPRDAEQRGAQLSILLSEDDLLEPVMQKFEANGVVVDERKPNVVRVAPAPLYNSFTDVLRFVTIFREALTTSDTGL